MRDELLRLIDLAEDVFPDDYKGRKALSEMCDGLRALAEKAGSAEPIDDNAPRALFARLADRVHNLSCEYQNDEALSRRLGDIATGAWELADKLSAAPPSQPVADREAARARFPDPAFQRWLDEGISDAGHTVFCSLGDVADAWAGWSAKDYYAQPVALPEPAFRLTWRDGQYRVSKPNIGNTDCYTADQVMSMLAAAPEVPRG